MLAAAASDFVRFHRHSVTMAASTSAPDLSSPTLEFGISSLKCSSRTATGPGELQNRADRMAIGSAVGEAFHNRRHWLGTTYLDLQPTDYAVLIS